MKALILCGGQGTRLREHTEVVPKPLVEIGGRPILWHLMKLYAHHGVREFVICLGYKGHLIRQYFLNYEAMNSDFTIELGKPDSIQYRGANHGENGWKVTLVDTGQNTMTGARVLRASRYLKDDESFCLTYGDGLSDVDLTRLIAFHQDHGKLATVTGVRPPSRFGEMECDGDRVASFTEKPQMQEGLINGGFFVLQRDFLNYLSDADDCVLEREPLAHCANDGQLYVFPHMGFWHCMDTYRDWLHLDGLWNRGEAPWKAQRAGPPVCSPAPYHLRTRAGSLSCH